MGAEQDSSRAVVGAGDEDIVAADDGVGGVDRLVDPGAELPLEPDGAIGGIEADQTLSKKTEDRALSVKCDGDR